MASSSSKNSGSSGSRVQPSVVCYHNEIAPIRVVSQQGPKYGKRFYGCSHWPRHCGFFQWVEDYNEIKELEIKVLEKDCTISELEHENHILKSEVRGLKKEVQEKQELVEQYSIECCERAIMMEDMFGKRRIYQVLLLSWVFFGLAFWLKY